MLSTGKHSAADIDGFSISSDGVLEKYTGYGDTVVVPEGVRVLGSGCINQPFGVLYGGIRKLVLPSTLREVREDAVCADTLEELILPEGLENIGRGAFFCGKIQKLVIPSTVRGIGAFAFGNTVREIVFCEGKHRVSLWLNSFSCSCQKVRIFWPYSIVSELEPLLFNPLGFADKDVDLHADRVDAHRQKPAVQKAMLNNYVRRMLSGERYPEKNRVFMQEFGKCQYRQTDPKRAQDLLLALILDRAFSFEELELVRDDVLRIQDAQLTAEFLEQMRGGDGRTLEMAYREAFG